MLKQLFTNKFFYQTALFITLLSLVFTYFLGYFLINMDNKVAMVFFLSMLPLPIIGITSLIIPFMVSASGTKLEINIKWYYNALTLFIITSCMLIFVDSFYYYMIDTSISDTLVDEMPAFLADANKDSQEASEEEMQKLPLMIQFLEVVLATIFINSFITSFFIHRKQNQNSSIS